MMHLQKKQRTNLNCLQQIILAETSGPHKTHLVVQHFSSALLCSDTEFLIVSLHDFFVLLKLDMKALEKDRL